MRHPCCLLGDYQAMKMKLIVWYGMIMIAGMYAISRIRKP